MSPLVPLTHSVLKADVFCDKPLRCAGVAPSSAIFMAVYEPVKHWVYRNSSEEQHWLGPVLAGMAAGAAASLTRVPTEVVKQRLQTREFAGALGAVSVAVLFELAMLL
jgi:hypothetical protein